MLTSTATGIAGLRTRFVPPLSLCGFIILVVASITAARPEVDRVPDLPGLTCALKSATYAGFVDVDATQKKNELYYIFFEHFHARSESSDPVSATRTDRGSSQHDTQRVPIFIWLNGGPGASSQVGNFLENGPYRLNSSSLLLDVNEFGWQNRAHTLYFDQPVGTGFSFTRNEAYPRTLEEVASQFHAALLAWFRKFPDLRKNPLYVSGESFAGAYIPVIAWTIHQRNVEQVRLGREQSADIINLRGILVGNPGNMRWQQYGFQPEFWRTHGLISDAEFGKALAMYADCERLMNDAPGVAGSAGDVLLASSGAAQSHQGQAEFPPAANPRLASLTPAALANANAAFEQCEAMSSYLQKSGGNPFLYDIRQYGDVFGDVYSVALAKYFGQTEIQKALHTQGEPWKNGDGTAAPNPVVNHLRSELMRDVTGFYASLLDAVPPQAQGTWQKSSHYNVMIYAGVMDGSSCGHLSVYDSVLSLRWGGEKAFRDASKEILRLGPKEDVWGYRQRAGPLAFVWVANAGHLVPTDQPRAGLAVLETFLGASDTEASSTAGLRLWELGVETQKKDDLQNATSRMEASRSISRMMLYRPAHP